MLTTMLLLDLDRHQLQRLDKEALIPLIQTLQQQVGQLAQAVAEQAAVIQALRGQLAKNRRNSPTAARAWDAALELSQHGRIARACNVRNDGRLNMGRGN